MKRKDVQVLLIVLGLLMALLSWQFVYNSNQEKTEAIRTENTALQSEVKMLEDLEAQKDKFLADTETMKAECDKMTALFPAGLLTEDEIMYFNNMEAAVMNQIVVPSISMGLANPVPYTGELSVDGYELKDEGIVMYNSPVNVSFTTTYSGLKNTINYIYQMPGRKAINSVNVSASADGYLTGSMSVDFYYMGGTTLLYTPVDIPAVPLGKDNIFGVLEQNTADAE